LDFNGCGLTIKYSVVTSRIISESFLRKLFKQKYQFLTKRDISNIILRIRAIRELKQPKDAKIINLGTFNVSYFAIYVQKSYLKI
jgi:hypothetical protein